MRKHKQNIYLLIFNLHHDYADLIPSDVWYSLYESESFGDIRHELIMDMLNIT